MSGIRKTKTNTEVASQIKTVGSVTYYGWALPGTSTSAAKWKMQKIDETSGVVISWADGNSYFDNIWDNYASLTYS